MPTLSITAGPDAGRTIALSTGRHLLGRAPAAAVMIADAAVEPHHAVVDVDDRGGVRIVQLTGRAPIRIDGRPAPADVPLVADAGRIAPVVVELGCSRLELAPVATSRLAGADRRPLPVVVPAAGGGDRVRFVADLQAAAERARAQPDGAADAFTVTLGHGRGPLALDLRNDTGVPVDVAALPFDLQADVDRVSGQADLPVRVDLAARHHRIIAVDADPDRAAAVTRSIVAALARRAADGWLLLPVLADRGEDGWLAAVPQLAAAFGGGAERDRRPPDLADRSALDRCAAVLAAGATGRRVVVWCDSPEALRTPGMRRLLASDTAVTALVTVPPGATLPPGPVARLVVGATWRGRWEPEPDDPSGEPPVDLHVAGRTRAPAAQDGAEQFGGDVAGSVAGSAADEEPDDIAPVEARDAPRPPARARTSSAPERDPARPTIVFLGTSDEMSAAEAVPRREHDPTVRRPVGGRDAAEARPPTLGDGDPRPVAGPAVLTRRRGPPIARRAATGGRGVAAGARFQMQRSCRRRAGGQAGGLTRRGGGPGACCRRRSGSGCGT